VPHTRRRDAGGAKPGFSVDVPRGRRLTHVRQGLADCQVKHSDTHCHRRRSILALAGGGAKGSQEPKEQAGLRNGKQRGREEQDRDRSAAGHCISSARQARYRSCVTPIVMAGPPSFWFKTPPASLGAGRPSPRLAGTIAAGRLRSGQESGGRASSGAGSGRQWPGRARPVSSATADGLTRPTYTWPPAERDRPRNSAWTATSGSGAVPPGCRWVAAACSAQAASASRSGSSIGGSSERVGRCRWWAMRHGGHFRVIGPGHRAR